MTMHALWGFVRDQVTSGYSLAFGKDWPAWLSGIFLAILALLIFMWWQTWGVAGGYNNWGSWVLYSLGFFSEPPSQTPLTNGMSVSNIGIVLGALASALLGRQFRIFRAPSLEYAKGLVGGVLMGAGAALAAGCNVGGFYSALGMFDLSGFTMMIGLFAGAYLGLRYLLWEMEHMPQKTSVQAAAQKNSKSLVHLKPFLGFGVFIMVLILFQVSSLLDQTQMGGLLFFGFLIGMVMHRGRFCFANAFREPFMTGDSRMMRAVLLSLLIYALGSAVIKWSYIQPPESGIYHPFWLGSLGGGLIFGVGMLLAGGCASGTLWRVGEGHVKLWVALFGFLLANPLTHKLIEACHIQAWLGSGIFMPEAISWQLTLGVYAVFVLALSLALIWNEKTEKFVAF